MTDASYGFLSVVRRGLAANIAPAAPPGDPRVPVPASLSIAGHPVSNLPALALRGPGDIVGFGRAAIRRTWPAAGASSAEPNYFALVEIGDADLPWRYTPAPANGDRLTPWLCLVVVKDAETAPLLPASRDRPLAVLTVNDAGALPDLAQAWAWAHAQVLGAPAPPATDVTAAALAALLATSPQRLLSRLLCPRKLEPQTSYLACVVPTFERGRRAGLGQPVDGVDRMAPAWRPGAAPVTLPVYHSWRFRTGRAGDFASLVHLLTARNDLPSEVWRRDLAVATPGAAPPAWQVVGLEGALRTLDATDEPWSGLDARGFTAALAPLLDAASPTQLAPTLYGRWLAGTATLSTAPGAPPPWFHELNGDPRARVAAGLGTLVVQAGQQDLLAHAWAQVDGVRRANQQLRLAQLARELATRLHQRHFSVGGDAFLQLTQPLHARVRSAGSTVHAQLQASPIAGGAIGATWRRVARPLGSLGVRQGRPSLPAHTATASALARMNAGALAIAPPPPAPPSGAPARLGDLGAALVKAGVVPDQLHTLPIPSGFTVQLAPPLALSAAATAAPPRAGAAPPTAAMAPIAIQPAAFKQAASALMAQLAVAARPGVSWTPANLDGIHTALATGLHPRQTVEQPIAARLTGVVAGPRRTDLLEPVMAAPAFPQPMYEPLGAQSLAWLIPGLDRVPPDTVATLTTNWPFVEAFLVGLNHEMARKLLWNGYPTDQRGTYFRRFWDIRSRGDAGTTGDIGPIHQWTAALGHNRPGGIDPLVLLVRGELIRRYPNVVVYAARGEAPGGVRQPGATEKQPLFFARLDPDVALFGFDLDRTEARGNPGWFFVLQEHPSEPRFGLAAAGTAWGARPSSWQVLGWDHLAASPEALAALRHIDLNAALPQNPTTPDPTGAVWHAGGAPGTRAGDLAHIAFRRPQRLAIHASMLVPDRTRR